MKLFYLETSDGTDLMLLKATTMGEAIDEVEEHYANSGQRFIVAKEYKEVDSSKHMVDTDW